MRRAPVALSSLAVRPLRASYLYPYRAVEQGLANRVREFAPLLRGGILVDVGCGERPYEAFFSVDRYVGVDVERSGRSTRRKQADVVYDGTRLPFADGEVDHLLCTQVMQYVAAPAETFAEFARVLRPGGNLLLSAPQSEPVTEAPFDRWRYTADGLRALCASHALAVSAVVPAVGYWQTHAFDVNCFIGTKIYNGRQPSVLRTAVFSAAGCVTQSFAGLLDRLTSYDRNINAWVLHAVRR